MIPQPKPASLFRQPTASPHLHINGDTCPLCEQVIPPDRLEEISGKIAKKEIEKERTIKAALETQHAIERAQAEAKAKEALELERQQSAAREELGREEARKAAEAVAADKLAEAQRIRLELQTALQGQVDQAKTARKAAEQAGADLKAQLQQSRQDGEAALAAAKADSQAREAEIRTQAQQAAEAELLERIAKAEEIKSAAEQKEAALQSQLADLHKAKDAEIEKLKEEAAATEIRIKQEATDAAEQLVQARIADKDQALADAQAKTLEAEGKLATLTEQQEAALNASLASQREVLENAKDDAINLEKAKAFEENLKLSNKVGELQRALEKKSNEELGEGAEIDLFEALKKEFPDDRIERVAKGAPGADIVHVVIHNRQECGTIIYDSKNHNAFRNDHVTKLRADQLAAKAEHAVLSTFKFPAGARHLHVQDGVLLASPARVVSVVTLIRQHVLQVHTLRVSSAERESKTVALYAFITSERCTQLFSRVDGHAEELLEQQVKEKKWHETAWKKEGELLRSIQKVQAELANEIGSIIGTAAAEPEMTLEDLL